MNVSKGFKNFVIKKMIKDARYNSRTKLFEIDQAALSRKDLHDIEIEGKFYNYDIEVINDLIIEINDEGLNQPGRVKHVREIDPANLKMEQHLKIYYVDDDRHNVDEFLKVGKSEFMLIDHNRGSLKPGIIMKTTTSPWMLNSKVKFEFLDEDSRIKYYHTGQVTKLELVAIPQIFDILQTKEGAFRKTVYAGTPKSNRGFVGMDLSTQISDGVYYSITQNGGIADYSFLEAQIYDIKKVVRDFEKIIAPVCDYEERPSADTAKVITLEKGMLSYSEGYWEIKRKAKVAFA